MDKQGNPVAAGQSGFLVIKKPWPAMLRTIYGDDEQLSPGPCWSTVPHVYFTADGARCDADGYIWIMGRVDDVLNVSGHRLSTMEVESALVHHPQVAEAAVVGKPDDLKGEGIACFVTLKAGVAASDALKKELASATSSRTSGAPRPARRDPLHRIAAEDAAPVRIMRRLLRYEHRRRQGDDGRHDDAGRFVGAGEIARG